MKQVFPIHRQSFFLRLFTIVLLGVVALSAFACARRDGCCGACREVFKGRYRSRSRQSSDSQRSSSCLRTRRFSISLPATRNSGSSMAPTTSATSIRPRLAFAAI